MKKSMFLTFWWAFWPAMFLLAALAGCLESTPPAAPTWVEAEDAGAGNGNDNDATETSDAETPPSCGWGKLPDGSYIPICFEEVETLDALCDEHGIVLFEAEDGRWWDICDPDVPDPVGENGTEIGNDNGNENENGNDAGNDDDSIIVRFTPVQDDDPIIFWIDPSGYRYWRSRGEAETLSTDEPWAEMVVLGKGGRWESNRTMEVWFDCLPPQWWPTEEPPWDWGNGPTEHHRGESVASSRRETFWTCIFIVRGD